MADIIIRNVNDETASAINALALAAGMSREEWLRRKLETIAQTGEYQPRIGQGIKAIASNGAEATIRLYQEDVGGGAKNMNQKQFTAYERAKLLADPRNGARFAEARKVLEEAGFEVFNV